MIRLEFFLDSLTVCSSFLASSFVASRNVSISFFNSMLIFFKRSFSSVNKKTVSCAFSLKSSRFWTCLPISSIIDWFSTLDFFIFVFFSFTFSNFFNVSETLISLSWFFKRRSRVFSSSCGIFSSANLRRDWSLFWSFSKLLYFAKRVSFFFSKSSFSDFNAAIWFWAASLTFCNLLVNTGIWSAVWFMYVRILLNKSPFSEHS